MWKISTEYIYEKVMKSLLSLISQQIITKVLDKT